MTAAIGHEALLSVPNTDPSLVSQTGHVLYRLVETSTRPFSFTVSINEPSFDITGFASPSPAFRSARAGVLKSWTGSFESYYPQATPSIGHLGLVAFTNGTTNRVNSYTLNFVTDTHDITGFNTSGWRDFRAGLNNGTGTYTCHVPTGTAATMVGQTGTATFTLSPDTAANTIAAPIVITDFQVVATIGDKQVITYSFQITDQITSAGTTTLLPAGAFSTPEQTYVEFFTVASSRSFKGFCHLTGLTISVAVGEAVTVSGTVQGTGELTAA